MGLGQEETRLRWVVLASIALGTILTLYFFFDKINDQVFAPSRDRIIFPFGGECEGSTGTAGHGWTPEQALHAFHRFSPQGLPFAAFPETSLGEISSDEYWISRCPLNLKHTIDNRPAFLSLGRVSGRTTVYLGERKVVDQPHDGHVSISLGDSDQVDGLVLTIIVTPTANGSPFIGPRTSDMIYYSVDTGGSVPQQRESDDLKLRDLTLLRIGVASALFLMMSGAWVIGFRYPDISWMVITLAFHAIYWVAVLYQPQIAIDGWFTSLLQCGQLAYSFAFLLFIQHYLRIASRCRMLTWITRLVFLISFFAIILCQIFSSTSLTIFTRAISSSILVISSILVVLAWRDVRPQPASRKLRSKAFAVVVAIYTIGAVAKFLLVQPWNVLSDDLFLLVLVSAAWILIADLVNYRHLFLSERLGRVSSTDERQRVSESINLGKTVQELLLPKMCAGQVNNLRFQFFLRSEHGFSRTWFQYWVRADGSVYFFLGEATGNGPSAALAIASMQCSLEISKQRDELMEDCLTQMNRTLHTLYSGIMTSRTMAFAVTADQLMTSWNCGGLGSIFLARDQCEVTRPHSTPVGLGADLRWDKRTWQGQSKKLLIAATEPLLGLNPRNGRLADLQRLVGKAGGDFSKIYQHLSSETEADSGTHDSTMFFLHFQ